MKYTGPERRRAPRTSNFQKLLDIAFTASRKLDVEPALEQRSGFWLVPTAHRLHWERHNNPDIYTYDPTDDGPEVLVIANVKRANYWGAHNAE